jgi:excinuclease ABC subunit B
MKTAIEETGRRRKIQEDYNRRNRITPKSIKKDITNILNSIYEADYWTVPAVAEEKVEYVDDHALQELEKEMREAAEQLEFEKAVELRNRIRAIRDRQIETGIRT